MGQLRGLRAVHHGEKPDLVTVSDHGSPAVYRPDPADAFLRSRRQNFLGHQTSQRRPQPAVFLPGWRAHGAAHLPGDNREIQRGYGHRAAVSVADDYRGVVCAGAEKAAGSVCAFRDPDLTGGDIFAGHPRRPHFTLHLACGFVLRHCLGLCRGILHDVSVNPDRPLRHLADCRLEYVDRRLNADAVLRRTRHRVCY